jgi:hypothetical protein
VGLVLRQQQHQELDLSNSYVSPLNSLALPVLNPDVQFIPLLYACIPLIVPESVSIIVKVSLL